MTINIKSITLTICALLGLVVSSLVGAKELGVKVTDPNGLPVEGLVVYVMAKDKAIAANANSKPLYIDQKDKKFSPYITVVQKGQPLNFTNKDDITHHIYSVSGQNRFEFKIKAGQEKTTSPLNAAEEVAMGCNIHDWMSGYALVVDTPIYGKTDNKGYVLFSALSDGEYEVFVWHPQLDTPNNRVFQKVVLTDDSQSIAVSLPKKLLPIPEQIGQDDFDFLEEY